MQYVWLKPCATLRDTLRMMRAHKKPVAVKLKRGLCLALNPGTRLIAFRQGTEPSRNELVEVVKAANQAGMGLTLMAARPDEWGGPGGHYKCAIWSLVDVSGLLSLNGLKVSVMRVD